MTDQFDQPRQLGPARKRVRLYVEQFLALAREGSQGEDDEQAPRIDTANHVTLDVRDLRVLAEEPDRTDHDAVVAERDELAERVAQLEAGRAMIHRNGRLAARIRAGRSPLTPEMIETIRANANADIDIPGPRVLQLLDKLEAKCE